MIRAVVFLILSSWYMFTHEGCGKPIERSIYKHVVRTSPSEVFMYDGKQWKILTKHPTFCQIFSIDGKIRTIPATTLVRILDK